MSNNNNDEDMAPALVGLFALASWPVAVMIDGYVLAKLWEWFAATTFGLPTITVAQAIGISMIVAHVSHQGTDYFDGRKHGWAVVCGRMLGWSFIRPWIILLTAAAVKGFLP